MSKLFVTQKTRERRMKFYYAVHEQKSPHTFLLFVNRTDLFTAPYQKYLSDRLRQSFGFDGCPLLLHARNRPKTIEPKRGFRRR
jgi:predicted GTPase